MMHRFVIDWLVDLYSSQSQKAHKWLPKYTSINQLVSLLNFGHLVHQVITALDSRVMPFNEPSCTAAE